METAEIKDFDTRYEGFRLKDIRRERMLQSSIIEKGVVEPLLVIQEPGGIPILIDGFKRLRSAKRCNIKRLPISVLETGQAPGILRFLRMSANKGLTQVEQACLVDELHQRHSLSISEIALHLERSPAWVSLRLGIWKEMGEFVREKIMSGLFPLHNYLYTLKRFKRLKTVSGKDVAFFVDTVSGKGLSTRDIELLAQGYFEGSDALKEQIQKGNTDWTLQQLKQQEKEMALPQDELGALEAKVLSHLNWTFVCMAKLTHMLHRADFENKAFYTKGNKIAEKIFNLKNGFFSSLEQFCDRA